MYVHVLPEAASLAISLTSRLIYLTNNRSRGALAFFCAGHMGFIDYKLSVGVGAADGWMRFDLPGMKAEGELMVCEPSTGWKRTESMANLDSPREITYRLGSAPLPLRSPSKYVLIDQCYRFAPGSTRSHSSHGDTALFVKAASGKEARISHVIWESAQ